MMASAHSIVGYLAGSDTRSRLPVATVWLLLAAIGPVQRTGLRRVTERVQTLVDPSESLLDRSHPLVKPVVVLLHLVVQTVDTSQSVRPARRRYGQSSSLRTARISVSTLPIRFTQTRPPSRPPNVSVAATIVPMMAFVSFVISLDSTPLYGTGARNNRGSGWSPTRSHLKRGRLDAVIAGACSSCPVDGNRRRRGAGHRPPQQDESGRRAERSVSVHRRRT